MTIRPISLMIIPVLALLALACALSGCLEKVPHELKSPCVAAPLIDGALSLQKHPCIRRPVNDAWLKTHRALA
jgi:hypothetical protein